MKTIEYVVFGDVKCRGIYSSKNQAMKRAKDLHHFKIVVYKVIKKSKIIFKKES